MSGQARDSVSVVVPFAGDEDAAREAIRNIRRLEIRSGDELIVADNTRDGSFPDPGPGVTVVPAAYEQSPFHARNVGAEHATGEWILFMDADCKPVPTLLDAYLATTPEESCGLVGGRVVASPGQPGLAPHYARSRRQLESEWHASVRPGWPHPAGVTGNMLVRAESWRELGGFHEGVIDGGDIEFSWRLQDAGWGFDTRPDAVVEHSHVTTIAGIAGQAYRHAAGCRWINRRYPGSFPLPRLAYPLLRCFAGALVWTVTGQFRRALYKLIDARWLIACSRGYLLGENRTKPVAGGSPALFAATFPPPAEGLIAGDRMRIEALGRPAALDQRSVRGRPINYAEDDRPLERFVAVLRVGGRSPISAIRARRRVGLSIAPLAPVALRLRGAEEVHFTRGSDDESCAVRILAGSLGDEKIS